MDRIEKNEVSVYHPTAAVLGESPVWHGGRESCYWVDIEGKRLYEHNQVKGTVRFFDIGARVSLAVPAEDGNLVLALQGGIAKFNPDTAQLSLITDLGLQWDNIRCNDGACNSSGALWIGTMDIEERDGAGVVYRVGKDLQVSTKIENVSISNGMAWSPDNKRLYYTDSLTREVWSYRYLEDTEEIFFEKVVIYIPPEMGLPDGMAMDAEGMLWIALWGGHGVSRWDVVTGKMIGFIRLPVPQVSSCAFVGKDLDQLLITTARKGMSEEELSLYPESGHTFIVNPGVKGLPRFCCRL